MEDEVENEVGGSQGKPSFICCSFILQIFVNYYDILDTGICGREM